MAHNLDNIKRYKKLMYQYFDGLGHGELIEELMSRVDNDIGAMDDEELAEQLRGLEEAEKATSTG